ncbi:hypothetical protein J4422_00080 [Candidatus Pacearchaeota archaeon]|nr:hypothetical protein [Candidatus Pacearchaeota archaeon]
MEERELVPGTVYQISEIDFKEANLTGLYFPVDLKENPQAKPHQVVFRKNGEIKYLNFTAYFIQNDSLRVMATNEGSPKKNEKEDLESRLKMAGL